MKTHLTCELTLSGAKVFFFFIKFPPSLSSLLSKVCSRRAKVLLLPSARQWTSVKSATRSRRPCAPPLLYYCTGRKMNDSCAPKSSWTTPEYPSLSEKQTIWTLFFKKMMVEDCEWNNMDSDQALLGRVLAGKNFYKDFKLI